MIKPNIRIMKAAIEIAEENGTPFGAALAMGDEIFVTAANQTKTLHDPTAHAELLAIRRLSDRLKKTDLSGFTLYTTCEPCPMCMSAAIWARIDTVFYGCDIPTISKYMGEIHLRAGTVAESGFSPTHVKGDIMITECLRLLDKFA